MPKAVAGPENLFCDIERTAPVQDFQAALNQALVSCAVMFVVIGPRRHRRRQSSRCRPLRG